MLSDPVWLLPAAFEPTAVFWVPLVSACPSASRRASRVPDRIQASVREQDEPANLSSLQRHYRFNDFKRGRQMAEEAYQYAALELREWLARPELAASLRPLAVERAVGV